MNAERLLALYDQVSDAPGAVPRLRHFVLDLAVRGKLVEQDPTDEPASELPKLIAAEKGRLVKAKLIRKPKALEPISATEHSVEMPHSWEAQRLGNLSTVITKGSTPTSYGHEFTDSGVNFLKVESIVGGRVDASSISSFISQETHEFLARSQLEAGDILFSIAGSIGTCALVTSETIPANTNQALAIVRGTSFIFNPDFLILLLRSFVSDAVKDKARGGAMNNVSLTDLQNLIVPLPPLAEQRRIVAKVEELMALLDRLEAARTAREATRDRLTAASLARLTAPDADPADFPAHARFALVTLPVLTTRPDQIKPLRQTILNLAVRGKLVEQDSTDEPASAPLDRAIDAKKLLREQRRIGRTEDPEYSDSPGEADAPRHWAWAYLADFALVLGGKRLPAGASFAKEPTKHIYIRVTDMKGGTISDEGTKFISTEVQKEIAKYTIDQEDIYITIAGTIGEVGIVPARFDGQNLTENAAKIVFREIDRGFLVLALHSDDVQQQFTEKTKQMAQPKLALKRILGSRVPIPPLAEQHRIVAKVDALMALCDRLEAALTTADATRARLLEALLHEALTPAVARPVEAVA